MSDTDSKLEVNAQFRAQYHADLLASFREHGARWTIIAKSLRYSLTAETVGFAIRKLVPEEVKVAVAKRKAEDALRQLAPRKRVRKRKPDEYRASSNRIRYDNTVRKPPAEDEADGIEHVKGSACPRITLPTLPCLQEPIYVIQNR